jgi:O-acetyl-ADP-ribose deacetylase (regulator of RNase III)
MIIYIKDDILNVKDGIIVHGVNCQGKMGKGLAYQIRNRYPKVYDEYIKYINENKDLLGKINIVEVNNNLFVVNLFSQFYYGTNNKNGSIRAIEQGMRELFSIADIDELHIPKIGCGLGGLDWDTEVKELINKLSKEFNCVFKVYEL